ncbi:pilus assembly protein TadG-related protein [Roseovarius sp. CAU 1744]|uniref:pilus assembly protein TadG-related protein n=1 Tax=Roseovarius sp. CAU 1744 TaxID=3140368 RepID=UPI00325A4E3D
MSYKTKFDFRGQSSCNNIVRHKLVPWLNRFRQKEDGAVVAFSLFLIILFLVMAGLGIDTMRHEMQRTRLASVADAASLAGAAAANNDAAKEAVREYFAKNGMADQLDAFGPDDVQITLNTSKVTVNTSLTVDTYLLGLSGVHTLSAAATATAEKRIPKLEIALVLDVSGSMAGDKLADLKVAAKQFVTTILDSADPGDAIISIVPFSFGVTPSDNLFNALNVAETHNYSTCIVFQESEFDNTAISPTQQYAQQIYTSRYDVSGNFQTLNSSWRSCYTDDYFRVLPYSISETDLHAKIDSLEADGNTSGHLGIKWAAGLLDPAFQPVVTQLIADGDVDAGLTNVPSEYNELATQKVVVMMGDGKNTSSYYFNDPNNLLDTSIAESHAIPDYRGPESDLWRVEYTTDVFDYAYRIRNPSRTSNDPSKCSSSRWECVYTTEDKTAYFLHDPDDSRYRDIDNSEWMTEAEFAAIPATLDGYQSHEQLSWENAWGQMTPDYYESITGIDDAFDDYSYQSRIDGSDKNTRMESSCNATKEKKIIIYTIGFEITAGGTAETYLRNCATTESNYYRASTDGNSDADDLDISSVFGSIASSIQNLRLTQ